MTFAHSRAMGGARAFAQGLEFGLRHEHARMHADQLGLERDLVGEQLVEASRMVSCAQAGRANSSHEGHDGDRADRHASAPFGTIATMWMRPASHSVTTSPSGPRTPAARNTGV